MSSPTVTQLLARWHPIVLLALLVGWGTGTAGCRPEAERQGTAAAPKQGFDGDWHLVKSESSAIDPWNDLRLDLAVGPSQVRVIRTWQGSYEYRLTDSVDVPVDGTAHPAPLAQWPDNRHIGAFARTDRPRRVTAQWLDDGHTLRLTSRFWVEVSQGTRRIRTYTEYRLAPDEERLVVLELRSTRPKARRYVFERRSSSTSSP